MPTYRFTLTRDTTESVSVEIDAGSLEEAQVIALANPPRSGWEQDDNTPQPPYLPDPSDYTQE